VKWTKLTFGKHKGKTLPQIIIADFDWFYWARDAEIFKGKLAEEADDLMAKATHIRIPKRKPKKWEVEYVSDRGGRFCGFSFVKCDSPYYDRTGNTLRLPVLDFLVIRRRKKYDKGGYRVFVDGFRRAFFGPRRRITKRRAERFFADRNNFVKVRN
jgi:hypothetical protein